MRLLISISVGLCALVSASVAQETYDNYQQRRSDLVELASIFGELHHIRRTCEPRLEADVWRERMKQLIELEAPQPEIHEEMVARFNKGYRAAQQHFPDCSRNAQDHAAARARMGDAIVARLIAPLYEAMTEEQNLPFVWTGDQSTLAVPDPDSN